MAEEKKKPDLSRAVTYCMHRTTRLGGRLCQAAIPVTERFCEDCKKERGEK